MQQPSNNTTREPEFVTENGQKFSPDFSPFLTGKAKTFVGETQRLLLRYTGPSETGLPIGLQAIGAPFADYKTIEVARLITEELGGFRAPEGFGD